MYFGFESVLKLYGSFIWNLVSENIDENEKTKELFKDEKKTEITVFDDTFDSTIPQSRVNTHLSSKTFESHEDSSSDSVEMDYIQADTKKISPVKSVSNVEKCLKQLMNQSLNVKNEDIINVKSKQMNLLIKIGLNTMRSNIVEKNKDLSGVKSFNENPDKNVNFHNYCLYNEDSKAVLPYKLKDIARKYHVQSKYSKTVSISNFLKCFQSWTLETKNKCFKTASNLRRIKTRR